MADWKSSVDAELASLRAQEAALKQAGKKAELKAIAKRKGELKLMKKKGISPVILNPSMSMPSMPSMPSNFPSVPAWVSNFPNFTMPSEEDATEFAGTLSFGTLTGFCSGYALKGIGRAGAFTVGCLFMALTGVQHAGYVDVNWKKIEDDVMTPLDMDGDGKVDANDAKLMVKKFARYMADKNSAVTASTYTVGLLLGLRKG